MTKFYGPFGEVELKRIEHGIAHFDYDIQNEDGSKSRKVPTPFDNDRELIITAEQRKHKIAGFVICSIGGGSYYAVE